MQQNKGLHEVYLEEVRKQLDTLNKIEDECFKQWESSKKLVMPDLNYLFCIQNCIKQKADILIPFAPK